MLCLIIKTFFIFPRSRPSLFYGGSLYGQKIFECSWVELKAHFWNLWRTHLNFTKNKRLLRHINFENVVKCYIKEKLPDSILENCKKEWYCVNKIFCKWTKGLVWINLWFRFYVKYITWKRCWIELSLAI